MEWMWTAVWAWFGWNVIAPAMLLFLVLLIVGLWQIPRMIRQARCSSWRCGDRAALRGVRHARLLHLGFAET